MTGRIIHCVSMSGGKDSTATAVYALETQPRDSLRFVFADTGNEHELTYEYLGYLEQALGIHIHWLRADFTDEIARQARYVASHWPAKLMKATPGLWRWMGDVRTRPATKPPTPIVKSMARRSAGWEWVPEVPALSAAQAEAVVARAVAALKPTGNPFLDLCIWKGRFPSRRAQFCTQHLKTIPLVEHQLSLIEAGECDAVWSWQGVRLDESDSRRTRLQGTGACVLAFDVAGGGVFNHRPILRWTAADAFEAAALYRLKPNPLYLMDMTRVGCMPCINASKDEVLAISKRFPGHIDRIDLWEGRVAQASKRLQASFFPDPHRDAHLDKRGIRKYVEWSKTARGGTEPDWIRTLEEPAACQSAYGLCE
jgi:3'-phosphoadenosine 5'-phosphosulfate sulfotransferase (PAPS reductase)/FAD synthetase